MLGFQNFICHDVGVLSLVTTEIPNFIIIIDTVGMSKADSLRGVNECSNMFIDCTHEVSGYFVAGVIRSNTQKDI